MHIRIYMGRDFKRKGNSYKGNKLLIRLPEATRKNCTAGRTPERITRYNEPGATQTEGGATTWKG